ncbi:MAG: hypothetical protein NVSMB25_02140 [Thermoleophilaceae bacterium]
MIAIVLIGLALATVIQSFSWNQTSHYALVRSIAHGTPRIDRYQDQTGDKAYFEGHWYSSRAPGLALLAVPWYGVLTAVDAPTFIREHQAQRGDDAMVWAVGLWANVLPALLLMLLVRHLAERIEPGYGTAAAVTTGLGTLLLPLGTLLFSHVLSALLGLASFALLWRERAGPGRIWKVTLAGLLTGYAMTVEYPLLFVAVVLGVYLLCGRRPIRNALAFSAAALVGLLPLAAYDHWAFGSIWHVAYADLPPHQSGFFGIRPPSLSVASSLLLSSRGLLTLGPVLFMSVVGLVLMHRRGHRAEARVIAAISLLYLLYNSGYYLPFGGAIPGPRFLATMLPFLGITLAFAYRRHPGPTIALAVASSVTMILATLTHPLVGYQPETAVWTRFAAAGDFQPTVLTAFGAGRGYVATLPFALLVGAGIALAIDATAPLKLDRGGFVRGAAAVLAWAAAATYLPSLLGIDSASEHKIAEAGDPVAAALHYGSHPIGHLCALALVVALAALALARARSRRTALTTG